MRFVVYTFAFKDGVPRLWDNELVACVVGVRIVGVVVAKGRCS